MRKAKFNKGDILYWYSVIVGRPVGGKVVEVEQRPYGNAYSLDCGKDGRWEVDEAKLTKRKNPKYVKTKVSIIKKTMGWN